MSAGRRGFERTHTARVQILDLPFLSCMAFGTVFYPLSLSLPVCPMGPVIPTLPGGVKSFICSMPVPLRGKPLTFGQPSPPKRTPDPVLAPHLLFSSHSGGHRGAGAGEQPWGRPPRRPPSPGNVPDSGTALQGVLEPPHGHAQQHKSQLRPLYCPQPREAGKWPSLGRGRL